MGVQWEVDGSKGNKYTVKIVKEGFICTCPAFKKCKHIDMIEARICGD